MDLEFTDRYGGVYQPPDIACPDCEGMGCYPLIDNRVPALVVPVEPLPDAERRLWEAAHRMAGDHECDGTHFVVCPSCQGKRSV